MSGKSKSYMKWKIFGINFQTIIIALVRDIISFSSTRARYQLEEEYGVPFRANIHERSAVNFSEWNNSNETIKTFMIWKRCLLSDEKIYSCTAKDLSDGSGDEFLRIRWISNCQLSKSFGIYCRVACSRFGWSGRNKEHERLRNLNFMFSSLSVRRWALNSSFRFKSAF